MFKRLDGKYIDHIFSFLCIGNENYWLDDHGIAVCNRRCNIRWRRYKQGVLADEFKDIHKGGYTDDELNSKMFDLRCTAIH